MDFVLAKRFPRQPEFVANVRRFVVDALAEGPFRALSENAELLASELTTNAVQHGSGGLVHIQLTGCGDTLCVKVRDSGRTTVPQPRNGRSNPLAEQGRGINIVEHLADTWGFQRDDDGTEVWFRLSTSPDGSGRLH
jgi:anti-sigma regulatory factor (Ser/Thr protein kinase)